MHLHATNTHCQLTTNDSLQMSDKCMPTSSKPKRFAKLTEREIDAIQLSYLNGEAGLRGLAQRHGVSHETIRKVVKADCVTPSQAAVYRLIHEHFDEFLLLIAKGVSPHIAAGTFGVSKYAYETLVANNTTLLDAINQQRCLSIAETEQCFAEAAKEEWKPALARLQALDLTRNDYRTVEEKSGPPTIAINMTWSRDDDVPTITVDGSGVD